LTLQFVYGLQLSASLFNKLGYADKARKYTKLAEKIKQATYALCWDSRKNLMADIPDKSSYSQHANIFAALTDAIPRQEAIKMLHDLYDRDDVLKASTQFQAYYHKALVKYGLGDQYLTSIDTWKQLIDWGFTTFPEYPDLNTRSDCHAWNAYPAYELFTIVCGIRIDAPGFKKITIKPNMGNLKWIKATLPWKNEAIRLKLNQSDNKIKGTITIPQGLHASFIWNEKEINLSAGINEINSGK
jgi:hypothetical protein